jgi:hypothetical protein
MKIQNLTVEPFASDTWQVEAHVIDSEGLPVAMCRTLEHAELFAAAPDLLAALQAIASHVPHKHTYPAAAVQDLQQLASAAIAKATKARP